MGLRQTPRPSWLAQVIYSIQHNHLTVLSGALMWLHAICTVVDGVVKDNDNNNNNNWLDEGLEIS